MKALRSDQRGIGFLVLVLAIVVLGAVAVVGLKVVDKHGTPGATSTVGSSASVPAQLKSKADVQKASAALDATNVNGVNPDSLDQELNSLL